MEEMNEEQKLAISEALDKQMRKESFEHALGKVMRHRDLSYDDYVQVMSQIREVAVKKKIKIEDAARFLALSD